MAKSIQKLQRRHPDAIIRDRAVVAQLYLTGVSQMAVSRHMNERDGIEYPYTPKMVEKDLAALRKQWLASGIRDFDQGRAEELAKIDALEVEAFDAWRRSQEGKSVSAKKVVEGGLHGIVREEQDREESSPGDPRFLALVQWCINKRCEINGYDAPLALDLTSGGKPMVFTLDLGENKPLEIEAEVIEPEALSPTVLLESGEEVPPSEEDLLEETG